MLSTKLIGLVALTASVLCNAELNIRVDAEQEPFETVTIENADGPKSKLFGVCLAAARSLDAKLYSIEIPDTLTEYVRYVPDHYDLIVPAVWTSLTMNPPVSSILECAIAASHDGYPMFKYNGGGVCKGANRTYNLAHVSACETQKREAVFISTNDTASSPCPLPGVINNGWVTSCLSINTDLMTKDQAVAWCAQRNAKIAGETQMTSFSDLVQTLNSLNVGTYNFFTSAARSGDGTWKWVETTDAVNTTLMVGPAGPSSDYVMYVKGSAAFKFDFGLISSFKAGALCIVEY